MKYYFYMAAAIMLTAVAFTIGAYFNVGYGSRPVPSISDADEIPSSLGSPAPF